MSLTLSHERWMKDQNLCKCLLYLWQELLLSLSPNGMTKSVNTLYLYSFSRLFDRKLSRPLIWCFLSIEQILHPKSLDGRYVRKKFLTNALCWGDIVGVGGGRGESCSKLWHFFRLWFQAPCHFQKSLSTAGDTPPSPHCLRNIPLHVIRKHQNLTVALNHHYYPVCLPFLSQKERTSLDPPYPKSLQFHQSLPSGRSKISWCYSWRKDYWIINEFFH